MRQDWNFDALLLGFPGNHVEGDPIHAIERQRAQLAPLAGTSESDNSVIVTRQSKPRTAIQLLILILMGRSLPSAWR